ncbi:TadE/TadG family type IV pilus assembly protein [Kordiimonas marina]|uniref:TadE/TadG family type IV pilus assembly protein n=1 Tax=Kordiimonas marina TaxID=2872312 RepID=UPI001FF4C1DD|nr:TadE/TadG family type IV pilus assembly protein [Kordiimonas marina]MCJ9428592.1 pilus assembly protein [Kordiimonas marina]
MRRGAHHKEKKRRHLGRFRWDISRDDRGSVIIETALGLPLMLSLIIGILEIAHYYYLSATLENAVLAASRYGITGSVATGTTRADTVKSLIAKNSFGAVDMNRLTITTSVYQQFADIGQPEPYTDQNGNGSYDAGEPYSDVNGNGKWDADMASAGLGGAGDIVLYRVSYDAPSLTGAFDWATKLIKISAAVAVRNEPY